MQHERREAAGHNAAWQLAAATIAAAVLETIRGRPAHVNIIATGRDAPTGLMELADTVTEMVVRHAYERGIRARRGIDF